MRFEGSVEEVIYRNDDNGYSVVRVKIDSIHDITTCVGCFPLVIEGENIILEGEWILDKLYGRQIRVSSAQIKLPTTEKSMIKYLSSGLFRGIGVKLATRIVSKYKERTFEVIEFAPNVLSTIKAISYEKALEIGQEFKNQKALQNVIMYLQSYDFTVGLAIKLYKVYGNSVQQKLEENPYQLVNDVVGIGFITADNIAKRIGIKKDSPFRVKAAIGYILSESANKKGDTFYNYDNLVSDALNILGLDKENYEDLIKSCIKECEKENSIILLDDDKNVMSSYFYNAEKSISKKLISLMNSTSNTFITDIDLDIRNFERYKGIKFHEKQAEAIVNSLQYGVNIITGGPGTGKTTIVEAILNILDLLGKSYALCAPTGRAAKRMSESTGREAKTIHRLLGINFESGALSFAHDETNPLDVDVVIVDEVSMCDVHIFNCLVRSIKNGSRFIMLGDKDQLPSVGAGNVLADMIRSKVIPVSYLTYIYRQDEKSMIVYNAHKINDGLFPKLDNNSKDFFFSEETDPAKILDTVVSLVSTRVTQKFNCNQKDIQILCPMKKGELGVENINRIIQNTINKSQEKIVKEKIEFRLNDRVIHTENDYQLEWTTNYDLSHGKGIFNGDMGYITAINPKKNIITVTFEDGKIANYVGADISELNLAYSISVHKSQGSEFKVVIIVLPPSISPFMTRNLIYTAITRAKEAVIIVGAKKTLSYMIGNNKILARNSKLLEFLKSEAEYSLDI